jgi:hypothetical protein
MRNLAALARNLAALARNGAGIFCQWRQVIKQAH